LFTLKILTVSESLKQELISLGICSGKKIEVIPLGLELNSFFKIEPRNEAGLNIGIIGRLVPIKNHCLFLAAAKSVIQINPGLRLKFKVIGDGELKGRLEEYTEKLKLLNFVEFLGWQKDLTNVYADLDIVALTSINEGTPVSLIEAMASGKAVVATDVGGVRDLLGEDSDVIDKSRDSFRVLNRGIIVRPQDSASFVAALNFILHSNTLRQEMGIRGRDFVKIRFTKERLIRDLEGLYVSLFDLKSVKARFNL
jgi:glycosyltransferase involved in cell wall biosynthesis